MADLITEMQDIMCRSCTECEANWCNGKDKQECRWMEKIAEVGQTIEKEIRNKAIDDFVELMKEVQESLFGQKYVDVRMIDEIADEMRGAT